MLTGNYTRYFNMSYDHLLMRTDADRQSKLFYQRLSSSKPMVQIAHLLVGTRWAYRPLSSGSIVSRLPGYFEPEHCERDVPAEDRRIVYEWIDAMAPYYATQEYARRGACAGCRSTTPRRPPPGA